MSRTIVFLVLVLSQDPVGTRATAGISARCDCSSSDNMKRNTLVEQAAYASLCLLLQLPPDIQRMILKRAIWLELRTEDSRFFLAMVCSQFREVVGRHFQTFYRLAFRDVKTLRWAKANGFNLKPLQQHVVEAVRLGCIETLQRIVDTFPPSEHAPRYLTYSGYACEEAASCGHLHVLKWLRGHDCPWNALICSNAAKGGHLDTLRWAISNGCPCDPQVLKWARENGCPEL